MYDTRAVCYSVLILLLAAVTSANLAKCSRLIDGATRQRSNAEGKFHFFLTLYNRTDQVYAYMPDTRYSVILRCDNSDQTHRKFRRFIISVDAQNTTEIDADIGTFELEDDTMTRFVDNCPNMIMETSRVDKSEISVSWKSPAEASVCVLLRVTVMEAPDTWYMDDSNLVLTMCPDLKAEADDQGPVLDTCYACDEAKYEVILEGQWSRNTHPKDFPKGLPVQFSDVIGASHTSNYSFWQNNNNASVGLQQVAKFGATRKFESELKKQTMYTKNNIRTIIKARGISYPSVTGKTFAVFRVDRDHHLMSLVSRIVPSPDWFIGVSSLELCLPNGSWIMTKQLNLYPYDAGIDSGVTYLSPDSPTDPQPIQRITSTYPNDSASPFFDPSGIDMKPLAKLYLNRQRLYEKTCADSETNKEPCSVTSWTDWNACSVSCGKGTQQRQRFLEDESNTEHCKSKINLTEERPCYNPQRPYCYDFIREQVTNMCELSSWSLWGQCVPTDHTTCSQGYRTRTRQLVDPNHPEYCLENFNLTQTIECENPSCEATDKVRQELSEMMGDYGEDSASEMEADETGMIEEWLQKCLDDHYTEWSAWQPCSSTCGPGTKVRSRLLLNNSDVGSDEQCKSQQKTCTAPIESCDFSEEEAKKICSEPMKEGRCKRKGSFIMSRSYFDKQSGRCQYFNYFGCGGNRNNFATKEDCYAVCGKFQKENFNGIEADSQVMTKDCEVSQWSEWSECENCRGSTISTRRIVSPARGEGKSCPKLVRWKKCNRMLSVCSLQRDERRRRFHREKNDKTRNEVSVNCKVTPWSTWSRCSMTTCDETQSRIRSVVVKPRGLWARLCPALAELRKCPRPKHCPQ